MSKEKKVYHPVGTMVLIRHDEDEKTTSGGIILPDTSSIKTLTGRIIRMPEKLKHNKMDYPFEELDRVIYDTRERIPCSLETNNREFLVEAEAIYAVVKLVNEEDDEDVPIERRTGK